MRASRWVFLGLVVAGLIAAEAAAAQQGGVRQRAPGVPLAPKPSAVYEDIAREDLPPGIDRPAPMRGEIRERRAERGAERELPMPKPVPSIIAR